MMTYQSLKVEALARPAMLEMGKLIAGGRAEVVLSADIRAHYARRPG